MGTIGNKEYLSVTQVAKLLGISRQAIHKRIKNGQIKAVKIGERFVISKDEVKKIVGDYVGHPLSDSEKAEIDKVIDKVIKDYKETLELLGDE